MTDLPSHLDAYRGKHLICRGIVWHGRRALLEFVDEDFAVISSAVVGETFAYEIADQRRYCTGHYVVKDRVDFVHEPCPHGQAASRGWQCERCNGSDDFRFAHVPGLSRRVSSRLSGYLAQEHWLYVATFSDGTTKIGTAAGSRKLYRLDEQGPALGTYVARAEDGWIVRSLESLVTTRLLLRQAVTSKSKVRGLAFPVERRQLRDDHQQVVDRVTRLIKDETSFPDIALVREDWTIPKDSLEILTSSTSCLRAIYDGVNDVGKHALRASGCVGSIVIDGGIDSNDSTPQVADLSRIRGIRCRLLEPGGKQWRQGTLQYGS